MNLLKKSLALFLTMLMLLSLAACGGNQEPGGEPEETPAVEPDPIRIAALKGPTAMGLVKLMSDEPQSADGPAYEFTLAASADEVTPLLMKGELDASGNPTLSVNPDSYSVDSADEQNPV